MTILKNALPKIKDRILGLISEAEQKAKNKAAANVANDSKQTTNSTSESLKQKEIVTIKSKNSSKK
ncbi:hypothetical protein [Malacoplasma muris]|uniref:hypothetical protein n=1 Tax=Malacoplasma muris TaxID=2119 RepID=UPI00398EA05B